METLDSILKRRSIRVFPQKFLASAFDLCYNKINI